MADQLGSDYQRLLASAAASNLGDGVRLAALPLLAVSLTDEPLLVSGLAAATFLPAVVLGPLGGAVIDRYDRRRLLVLGQLGRGLAGALFVLALLGDVVGIAGVYVLALLLGAGEVVVDGASQAAIPSLVPARLLERANARMISAQLVLDQMVGAALGGLTFALGPVVPFAIDAGTFLVGGGAAATIGRPLPPIVDDDAPATTVRQDVREGLRFLRESPLLWGMAWSIGLTNLAMSTAGGVLVLLVVDELGAADATFGFVLAAGAVAAFVGSVVAERFVARWGRAAVLVGGVLAEVVALLVTGLAPNVLVVAVGTAVSGVAVVAVNVPGRAVRQEAAPDHLLGRVITSYRVLGYLGIPLGAVLGGVVTDLTDVRVAYLVAAGLMLASAVTMRRAVRHLPGVQPPATSS